RRPRGQAMEATTPAYPTRLRETQWATVAAYFAADSQLGRPRNTNLQPWSKPFCTSCAPVLALPWEFPPWQTVYGYFRPWRDQGSWKRIHRYLRGWYGSGASAPSPPGWPSPIRSRCRWAASPTGPEALTEVNGSKGASAMCWWTAWACSWWWSLLPPS
ncbi:MAG: hypothetical protein BRC36_02985, partial [Cyanobacteria bacterium QH_2_48_84]